MSVFVAVLLVFSVSYILAKVSTAKDLEHRREVLRKYENMRRKRIDALYGRNDEDS